MSVISKQPSGRTRQEILKDIRQYSDLWCHCVNTLDGPEDLAALEEIENLLEGFHLELISKKKE